ncbi:MAG: Bax inhibitor-1/YccA family protein [Mycobacteriaceae bacterium]
MRTSSNPVFRSLPKGQGGYANFGSAAAGAGFATQQYGQPDLTKQYPASGSRALTIDDVVTKTGITLGVLSLTAIVSFFLVNGNTALATPFVLVGGLGGFVLVMIATFGRKQDNPAIVLSYAALEGLVLGALSFVLTFNVSGASAGGLIGQAILGTFGVFGGMLIVYKTGAIRVTPKFTRMMFAGMIGVLVLMLGNLVASFFTDGGFGLRENGPLGIIFSLVCIGLAAFSFLLDFDQADQAIRAGAPERAAWGIALGLTVTLVWLYIEILRLLSMLQND